MPAGAGRVARLPAHPEHARVTTPGAARAAYQ